MCVDLLLLGGMQVWAWGRLSHPSVDPLRASTWGLVTVTVFLCDPNEQTFYGFCHMRLRGRDCRFVLIFRPYLVHYLKFAPYHIGCLDTCMEY
jgi:hypothetical protein